MYRHVSFSRPLFSKLLHPGDACDHSLLEGTRFLPAADPLRAGRSGSKGCQSEARNLALGEEFDRWFEGKQVGCWDCCWICRCGD